MLPMLWYFCCMAADRCDFNALAPRICRERAKTEGVNNRPYFWCTGRTGMEVKMSDLDEALKHALSLDVRDRAALAERLLASLEELPEEEADRLRAEEAQRRLDTYREGRARAVRAEEVHEKAGDLGSGL